MVWKVVEFDAEPMESEELVAWLGRLLAREGVRVVQARETDWGLELVVQLGHRRTLLGVGRLEGSRRTYRAFTRPPQILDYLLGYHRISLRAEVLKRLERGLARDPGASGVRWVELG